MKRIFFAFVFAVVAAQAAPAHADQAYHRLTPLSLSFGQGFGGELVGYEYVNRSRWGFRITPLSGYAGVKDYSERETVGSVTVTDSALDKGTTAYTPFWVRRYLTRDTSGGWPFLGVGLSVVSSWRDHPLSPDEEKNGVLPMLEAGVDFGGEGLNGSFSLRHVPASYYPLTMVSVGLSYTWKGRQGN